MKVEAPLLDKAKQLLDFRNVKVTVANIDGYFRIDLPAPSGADFSLSLFLFPDQDAQIGANRLGSAENEYFFYRAYEVVGYSSAEKLHEHFLRDLEMMISNPIQIRQTHGWFWEHFKMMINIGGAEKCLEGCTGLRLGGCEPPPIIGKQAYYHSPAIAQTCKH